MSDKFSLPNAYPDQTRNRRHRLLLWPAGLFILLGASSLVHSIWQRVRVAEEEAIVSSEIRRLAANYDSLVKEVFDLQQELSVRSSGIIPNLMSITTITSVEGTPIAGARPVPDLPRTDFDSASARKEILVIPHSDSRARLRFMVGGDAQRNAGIISKLTEKGFTPQVSRTQLNNPTNSLVFGQAVPIADVRLAVFILLAEGIEIKRVRHSPDPAMSGTIELSHVRHLLDWPTLPVETVRRLDEIQ